MDTLTRLEKTIAQRRQADPSQSYVASLHAKGLPQIARKLGEEGVEAAVAALSGSSEELVGAFRALPRRLRRARTTTRTSL